MNDEVVTVCDGATEEVGVVHCRYAAVVRLRAE